MRNLAMGLMMVVAGYLVTGCGKPADESKPAAPPKPAKLDMAAFQGDWGVDFDRTMEEGKKSPKYKEEDAEKVGEVIRKFMERMSLKVTDKELVYKMGDKEKAFPWVLKSADEKSVTVEVENGQEKADMTFSLVGEKLLNIRNSASDDMDFYIWKKK